MKTAVLLLFGIFSCSLFTILNAATFSKPLKNQFHKLRGFYNNQKPSDNPNDGPIYNYTTAWYPTMPVDHIHGSTQKTFQLRYFYNLDSYKPGGPLFFYTGNEGYLESFAQNTGIMWDLAPKFNAAIVFAEHRFYGYTYPFGNQSYSNVKYLRFLDVEQVLADYVVLINNVKRTLINDTNANVIAFGGSYGGMLVSWFRVKYPNVTVGGWASSAPLIYFKDGGVPVDAFSHITKTTFVASGCDGDKIPKGFDAIQRLAQTDEGRKKINQIFKLDKNSLLQTFDDCWNVIYYVQTAIEYMAMTDYPYSSSFLQPMPAWPVEESCKGLMATDNSDEGLVQGLYNIANVYYNGTGNLNETCFYNCPGAHDALGSPDGWPWQECTQIIIEMCDSGPPNDFFWKDCDASTVFESQVSYCFEAFGSRGWSTSQIKENYVKNTFGFSYAGVSNLILTSGTYDPWYSGCLKRNLYDFQTSYQRGLYVFELEGSAHHLDLRQPNTCDPQNIENVRFQITNILWCWAYPLQCTQMNSKPADLPPFIKKSVDCKPVFYGYPWGQQ
uniref:Uncharacterized protein n=1 Tax=Panagrolaimus sp. PS1159 TaxID=55785 RepID=A0AC35GMG2_9BILA